MSASIVNRGATGMLDVEVQLQAAADDTPDESQLIAWARAAWQRPGDDAEVVLRVTDETESRQLNHDYRGIDKPTNVLSFPFEPIPQIELEHIGDLVICAPVVEREAREQGKTASAHWAHMVVHGMLHLQGYDHQTDPQAVAMETLETDILTGLGFPAPYSDDEET